MRIDETVVNQVGHCDDVVYIVLASHEDSMASIVCLFLYPDLNKLEDGSGSLNEDRFDTLGLMAQGLDYLGYGKVQALLLDPFAALQVITGGAIKKVLYVAQDIVDRNDVLVDDPAFSVWIL